MRELIDPIRRECECKTGEKGRERLIGELAHEQVHSEARQHDRGKEHQVVREDDVAGYREDRERLQHLRRQMLGVRQGQRLRIEDVAVPVLQQCGRVAAEGTQHLAARPQQHPAVEQRVAGVSGDLAGDDGSERPRREESRG